MFPNGLHMPLVDRDPGGRGAGRHLRHAAGRAHLKLRGDYLAIVTLGFGEIIRVFLNNLDHPVNITNGPKGLNQIDPIHFWAVNLGRPTEIFGFEIASVTLYYYLFLALVVVSVVICHRLETVAHRPRLDGDPRGRDRGQGDGHQHPQHEAAGLRHGRHLRRRLRLDVRRLPAASSRPSRSA